MLRIETVYEARPQDTRYAEIVYRPVKTNTMGGAGKAAHVTHVCNEITL